MWKNFGTMSEVESLNWYLSRSRLYRRQKGSLWFLPHSLGNLSYFYHLWIWHTSISNAGMKIRVKEGHPVLGGVYMTQGRLLPWSEFTPVPSNGSIFVFMIPPQNVMPARVTPAWVQPSCCTGARISLQNEMSQRCHVKAKRPPVSVWNRSASNVCEFESYVYFINMKRTFK